MLLLEEIGKKSGANAVRLVYVWRIPTLNIIWRILDTWTGNRFPTLTFSKGRSLISKEEVDTIRTTVVFDHLSPRP
jgi:hypothetical protein